MRPLAVLFALALALVAIAVDDVDERWYSDRQNLPLFLGAALVLAFLPAVASAVLWSRP